MDVTRQKPPAAMQIFKDTIKTLLGFAGVRAIRGESYDRLIKIISALEDDLRQARKDTYQACLNTLKAGKSQLNIVVIGANDGKINDPIYEFANQNRDSISIALIEPQEALIPHLKTNYQRYPRCTIINAAIGTTGSIGLYSIKKEFWADYQPSYAEGWPDYRAATGISSTNRQTLENHIHLYAPGLDPIQAIQHTLVPSNSLLATLEPTGHPKDVDILQVDTEGFDDEVLYNSNLDILMPKLIHYESAHLDHSRHLKIMDYLREMGYRVYPCNGNDIAVSTNHCS